MKKVLMLWALLLAMTAPAWAADIDVGPGTLLWTGGFNYIVTGQVVIESRIMVVGSATLILNDGCTLFTNGITVSAGNSLTITTPSGAAGTGRLYAGGEEHESGIGGGADSGDAGNITILGGTIRARGGSLGGAGIGGGDYGNGGNITIAGGTVEALGTRSGAGIGGGRKGSGGNITIIGGTVEATGGDNPDAYGMGGAGIGGGGADMGYGTWPDGGNITISGGKVKAKGGEGHARSGAGIGGGGGCNGGTITITGGIVKATGAQARSDQRYTGAGIGGGGTGSGGTITISGGSVYAEGGGNGATSIGAGGDDGDRNNGTLSSGTNGCACVIAPDIGADTTNFTSGILSPNLDYAYVYGSPVISTDAEILNPTMLLIKKGQTLTIAPDTKLTLLGSIVMTNDGTLINNGMLDLWGSIANNGQIANAGKMTSVDGTQTIDNNGRIDNTGTIDGRGTLNNSGQISNTGTISSDCAIVPNHDSALTINNTGRIDNDGRICGKGSLNNNGKLTNSGEISCDSSHTLNNYVQLDNTGTIGGGGKLNNNNNAKLTNSGKISCDSSHTLNNNGRLDNTGTIGGSGKLNNNSLIDNWGTISIPVNGKGLVLTRGSGELKGKITLKNDIAVAGTLKVARGGVLTVARGAKLTVADGGKLENDGIIRNEGIIRVPVGTDIIKLRINDLRYYKSDRGYIEMGGRYYNRSGWVIMVPVPKPLTLAEDAAVNNAIIRYLDLSVTKGLADEEAEEPSDGRAEVKSGDILLYTDPEEGSLRTMKVDVEAGRNEYAVIAKGQMGDDAYGDVKDGTIVYVASFVDPNDEMNAVDVEFGEVPAAEAGAEALDLTTVIVNGKASEEVQKLPEYEYTPSGLVDGQGLAIYEDEETKERVLVIFDGNDDETDGFASAIIYAKEGSGGVRRGGSSGCSAGFGMAALLALGLFGIKKRRR